MTPVNDKQVKYPIARKSHSHWILSTTYVPRKRGTKVQIRSNSEWQGITPGYNRSYDTKEEAEAVTVSFLHWIMTGFQSHASPSAQQGEGA
jgi:hypothetical protein